MTQSRSVIYTLPMEKLNALLGNFGLEKTWISLLATHIKTAGGREVQYILKDKRFCDVEVQSIDFLKGLSLGEMSALYEYSLAFVDRDKRKQSGQYFTPDDVAQVMARKALAFPKGKVWIDPCSGIGNLSYWLVDAQNNPEEFLKRNIILVDRDELALFIARCIFAVHFQKKDPRLFQSIKNRFIVADFLFARELPKYDFAILNPPYVSVEPDARFITSGARDMYAYFLERVIQTTSGFVSITPQTFTNGHKFNSFRRLLLSSFEDISVYCFDNVPDNIFRGIKFGSSNTNKANSTRAGIIVARKSKEHHFRITPLLRWRVQERQLLLDSVDEFLVGVTPKVDVFPKVQKDLLPLYTGIKKQHKILAQLLSSRPTPYKLIVPSTPRYFISALKRSVKRSSFRTLYFHTERERDIAYLFLNSSYMYWWWRVNDGGMTISERTLLTLPIPEDISVNKELLSKIEMSEKTNVVVKRNAGKDNENVKHDMSLIQEINKWLFPEFEKKLAGLHNNSVIQTV